MLYGSYDSIRSISIKDEELCWSFTWVLVLYNIARVLLHSNKLVFTLMIYVIFGVIVTYGKTIIISVAIVVLTGLLLYFVK